MEPEQILLYSLLALMVFLYIRKSILAKSLNNYTGAETIQRLKSGSILLDVRTVNERRSRSIPSSLHIPLNELSSRMKELEAFRDKEIICYCASGTRSVSAGIKLTKAGFVAGNLRGGISSWNF